MDGTLGIESNFQICEAIKMADSRFTFCKDVAEARRVLEREPMNGCTVLLKGSNAVHLPELKDVL